VFEAGQQEIAEPAAVWFGQTEVILLQKHCKELLSQVLSIGRTVPLASRVSVKGIPVGAAKLFESGSRLETVSLPGQEHHAPMRRVKTARSVAGRGPEFFAERRLIGVVAHAGKQ
jgi:hypothetical protein